MERHYFKAGKKSHKVSLAKGEPGRARAAVDEGPEKEVSYQELGEHAFIVELPGGRFPVYLARRGQDIFVQIHGRAFHLREEGAEHAAHDDSGGGAEDKTICAPMPGKVVKVLVAPGAAVRRAQPVIILDSMKVEIELKASADGKVREVLVQAGQQLDMDQPLIALE